MPVVEILRGLFRKIVKIDGSTRPMGGPNTTVPAWMSTPVYDPLNGEVIAGVDGNERIELAADGKLYPPLCAGGYPPSKTSRLNTFAQSRADEITAGAPLTIAAAGTQWNVVIVKPAAAALTLTGAAAATFPAGTVDLVIPLGLVLGALTAQAGVASCWCFRTQMTFEVATVVSR